MESGEYFTEGFQSNVGSQVPKAPDVLAYTTQPERATAYVAVADSLGAAGLTVSIVDFDDVDGVDRFIRHVQQSDQFDTRHGVRDGVRTADRIRSQVVDYAQRNGQALIEVHKPTESTLHELNFFPMVNAMLVGKS